MNVHIDDDNNILCCPHCGSDKMVVTEETMWFVNGGGFYCHSVKAHDSDAKATCLDCRWEGRLDQLKTEQVE